MEADGIDSRADTTLSVQKAIDDFLADAKNHLEASTQKQYRILFAKLNDFCKQHGFVFLPPIGSHAGSGISELVDLCPTHSREESRKFEAVLYVVCGEWLA